MQERLSDLADRDIIDLDSGARLGSLRDAIVDPENGRILALIVPGRLKSLGLLGREEETVIPWETVEKIGADLIFVRLGRRQPPQRQMW